MTISSILVQIPHEGDLRLLIFPAVLLMYYLICWLLIGRDPKIENVATQYDAPPGISPGVARYVLTGGSDGTTLAAILADLSAKQVISAQPEGRSYRIKILDDKATVMPEEAAFLKTLLDVELAVHAYPVAHIAKTGSISSPVLLSQDPRGEALLDPGAGQEIRSILDSIQAALRDNLKGVYFRWNFGFVGAGIIATFVWAMAVAWSLETPQGSPLFSTFWLLFFTTAAGLVISGVWISRPAHPTLKQRIQQLILPLLFFLLPGLVIYGTLPNAHGFVVALLISVALNNVFFVLMRAPTAEGRRVLQQLAGFREFLVRVEQDRLERLNSPSAKAELMDRFLPYAIALNVREGWGDRLAAAFSNVIVER